MSIKILVEIKRPGHDHRQTEVEFESQEELERTLDTVVSDHIWQHGAHFFPIEGESGYEGWSRFEINISPPIEEI